MAKREEEACHSSFMLVSPALSSFFSRPDRNMNAQLLRVCARRRAARLDEVPCRTFHLSPASIMSLSETQ